MISKSLQRYLDKLEVNADAVTHKTVYTAYDLAQTTKVRLEAIAKTLLLKVEPYYGARKSKYVIAVLPASHRLDLAKLKRVLQVRRVFIPQERVMARLFRVPPGALTPFGPFHRQTPVVIDRALLKSKKVLVRSGRFTESLLLAAKDLVRAAEGTLAVFAKKSKRK